MATKIVNNKTKTAQDGIRLHPVKKKHYLRAVININFGKRLIIKDFPSSEQGTKDADAYMLSMIADSMAKGDSATAHAIHCIDEERI